MALLLPTWDGKEYADLLPSERDKIVATFPAPLKEGELEAFPTFTNDQEFACLYQSGGRECLVLVNDERDFEMFQKSPAHSQFRWYILDDLDEYILDLD